MIAQLTVLVEEPGIRGTLRRQRRRYLLLVEAGNGVRHHSRAGLPALVGRHHLVGGQPVVAAVAVGHHDIAA